MAAKLVLNKNKMDSSTECLWMLHWLLVKARIEFKIMNLTFRCLNGIGPSYLTDLLCINKSRAGLWSGANEDNLIIPYVKNKTFAARSFSVVAPKLWNKLPVIVKKSSTADEFKSRLKTHLFTQYFEENCDWIYY